MAAASLHTISERDGSIRGADDEAPRVWTVREAWAASGSPARIAAMMTVSMLVAAGISQRDPTVIAAVGVIALVPAGLVDLIDNRLPNRMVSHAAFAFCGAVTASVIGLTTPLPNGWFGDLATGAGLMAGPLLVMHLVSPSSMGFGDVKVALVLGACVGVIQPQLALIALLVASGGTALIGLTTRRRHLPFGPGLILGTAISIAVSPMLPASSTAEATTLEHRHDGRIEVDR